jgi:hypothetical protein
VEQIVIYFSVPSSSHPVAADLENERMHAETVEMEEGKTNDGEKAEDEIKNYPDRPIPLSAAVPRGHRIGHKYKSSPLR